MSTCVRRDGRGCVRCLQVELTPRAELAEPRPTQKTGSVVRRSLPSRFPQGMARFPHSVGSAWKSWSHQTEPRSGHEARLWQGPRPLATRIGLRVGTRSKPFPLGSPRKTLAPAPAAARTNRVRAVRRSVFWLRDGERAIINEKNEAKTQGKVSQERGRKFPGDIIKASETSHCSELISKREDRRKIYVILS